MLLSCQYQSNKHRTSQGAAGDVQKLQYNEVTIVVILNLKWLYSSLKMFDLWGLKSSMWVQVCKSIVTVRYYIDSCGAMPVSSQSKNANFNY